jgi:hypothetical protein
MFDQVVAAGEAFVADTCAAGYGACIAIKNNSVRIGTKEGGIWLDCRRGLRMERVRRFDVQGKSGVPTP